MHGNLTVLFKFGKFATHIMVKSSFPHRKAVHVMNSVKPTDLCGFVTEFFLNYYCFPKYNIKHFLLFWNVYLCVSRVDPAVLMGLWGAPDAVGHLMHSLRYLVNWLRIL